MFPLNTFSNLCIFFLLLMIYSAAGWVGVTADSSSENAKTKKLLLTEKGKEFVIDKILLNDRIEDEVWSLLTEEEQKTLVALTKKYNGFLLETTKKYIP